MMSRTERRDGHARPKNHISHPQSRPVDSPADCSSKDTTTALRDPQPAGQARKQLPFHILTAYLHIDDVPRIPDTKCRLLIRPYSELSSIHGLRSSNYLWAATTDVRASLSCEVCGLLYIICILRSAWKLYRISRSLGAYDPDRRGRSSYWYDSEKSSDIVYTRTSIPVACNR